MKIPYIGKNDLKVSETPVKPSRPTGKEAAKRNAETVGVRPEHISLSGAIGEWRGKIRKVEHLGADTLLHVKTEDVGTITVRASGEFDIAYGNQVYLTPDLSKIHLFAKSGEAIQ